MLTGAVGLVLGLIFLTVGIIKHTRSKLGEKVCGGAASNPGTGRRVTGSRPAWATHSPDIKDMK